MRRILCEGQRFRYMLDLGGWAAPNPGPVTVARGIDALPRPLPIRVPVEQVALAQGRDSVVRDGRDWGGTEAGLRWAPRATIPIPLTSVYL